MRYLRSQRGATVVEAVVALALAGIIVTALMSMVVSALSTSTASKNRTFATRYAEAAVESVRSIRDSQNWSDFYTNYVQGHSTTIWYLAADNSLTSTSSSAANIAPFTRTIKLTDNSPSGDAKSRVFIDIKVTWNDRGQTQTEEQTTYLTQWVTQ